ncbi:MAG: fibronectin type III domain-containing protein, partial [Bacteroidota bacterium]
NIAVLTVRSTGSESYDAPRPISWYRESTPEGNPARIFFTGLGHNASNFTGDDDFIKHIELATLWAGNFQASSTNTPPAFSLDGVVDLQEDFQNTFTLTLTPDEVPAGEESQIVSYSLDPESLAFVDVNLNTETGEIQFSAIANANGLDSLTLIADDGQAENNLFSRKFEIKVAAVNDRPTFSLSRSSVSLEVNFATNEKVTVTADPVPSDESEQSVSYTLEPASVTFADVSIDPNSGEVSIASVMAETGEQLFYIVADDGTDTARQEFLLRVSEPTPILIVSPDNLSFPPAGGAQTASIESNGDWSVINTPGWITPEETSGNGDADIDLTASANNGGARNGWVIVEQGTIRDSIRVTQVELSATPSVTITSPTNNSQVDSSFFLIFVIQNWQISQGGRHFHYFIDDQDQGPVYSANPLFLQGLSLGTHIIKIQLAEADHTLTQYVDSITVEVVPATVLTTNPETVIFLSEGGTQTLEITANVSWVIENSLTWLSFSDTSGTNNANITLTAQENTDEGSRTGNVILRGSDKSVFIEVIQEGATPSPCTPPDSMWVSDQTLNGVTLRWKGLEKADEYQILYRQSGAMEWIQAFGLTADSLIVENLLEDTSYEWQIRSRCFATYSAWSLIMNFRTAAPFVCGPPENILVTERQSTTLSLDWEDSDGRVGYEASIRKSGESEWERQLVVPSEVSWDSLEAETLYEYRIRSFCMMDTSEWTSVDTISTIAESLVCEIPEGLQVLEIMSDLASVNWQSVQGVSVYRVRIRTNDGQGWSPASTASDTTWIFPNLNPGRTYEWQVEAICGSISSGYSDLASFQTSGDTMSSIPDFEVNLSSFSVIEESGLVILNWESDLEIGGDSYIVERGIDGSLFEEIGTLSFQNMGAAYQFQDDSPPIGEVFYRIKMIGQNDSIEYSEIESLVIEVDEVTFQAYPNPVIDILTINLQSESSRRIYLILFDNLGRKMWSKELDINVGSQRVEIDMSAYQTQLYHLSLVELGLTSSENSIKNVRVQKMD